MRLFLTNSYGIIVTKSSRSPGYTYLFRRVGGRMEMNMAIYVTSDLHGYPTQAFRSFLRESGFGDADWLYVLGDVIDRNGDGGIETLRWLMCCPNASLIRGNHEEMLLSCRWMFRAITEETVESMTASQLRAMENWLANGAAPTMKSLRALLHRSPELVENILDYLEETPLYETVDAGGRSFVLVHAGLGGFRADKRLPEYTARELLWTRPSAEDRYFENALTVLGHTPTNRYGCAGRAFRTDSWINIDVGGAEGHPPMLLRLDDLRAFYAP